MAAVETEIKLLASPPMLQALRRAPILAGEEHSAKLVTTYFDTADGRLHHAGASLRLRSSDGTREQTFKQSGQSIGKKPRRHAEHAAAAVRRQESTVAATADIPDPQIFAPAAAAALTQAIDGEALAGFADVQVLRATRLVRHGGALIEVAFDTGTIAAAGQAEAICELELELVEGQLADALGLALALPLGPELRWSVATKGGRAFALAHGEAAQPDRARDIVLTQMSVAQGVRTICWSCLDHLLGNYGLVIAANSNEALHQCRVAIRRLRAALSLFSGSIEHASATRFRVDFRRVASAMGEARELHVLLDALAKAGKGGDEDGCELIAELGARRDIAVAAAAAQLASESFQRLLFEFAGWIETVDVPGPAPETLPEFAARVLYRNRKVVKRAARHLHAMTDHELHRLRIKTKKLRYAVEFFACVGGQARAGDAKNYADVLGKLQDQLGSLHDLSERAVDSPLLAAYEPARATQLRDELERRLGPAGAVRGDLVDASAQAVAKLLALPRWWRPDKQERDVGHDRDKHGGHELRALQIKLTAMQRRIIAEGRKLLVIFEGRDGAGKDGTIRHIVEHMSPRDTRVVALGVPRDRDRTAWYFQRWCSQLPVGGEIVLFNRSWYNRAGVERVMGFCTDAEYEEFMETVVLFEQMLVHSGLTIIKYYLDIDKDEQKRRLRDRERDPLKQWKISPIDKKAVRNWDKYSEARNAMLARTHSIFAPWVVVKADNKPTARLAVIRDLLVRSGLSDPDGTVLPDPATAFVYDGSALEGGWLAK